MCSKKGILTRARIFTLFFCLDSCTASTIKQPSAIFWHGWIHLASPASGEADPECSTSSSSYPLPSSSTPQMIRHHQLLFPAILWRQQTSVFFSGLPQNVLLKTCLFLRYCHFKATGFTSSLLLFQGSKLHPHQNVDDAILSSSQKH